MSELLTAFPGEHGPGTLLAKLTLLLLFAWGLHAALRRSHPQWRVWLWRAVTAAAPVLFLWSAMLPQWTWDLAILEPVVESRRGDSASAGMSLAHEAHIATALPSSSTSSTAFVPRVTGSVPGPQSAPPVTSHVLDSTKSGFRISWADVPLIVWMLIALCLLGRLPIQGAQARRLARGGRPAPDEVVAAGLAAARELALGAHVEFRVCERLVSPFVTGIGRAVVVIPQSLLRTLDATQLRLVLLHELAHVRGRDLPWSIAVRVMQSLLWFHPLAWGLNRAHRQSCEAACDSLAAAADRGSYRQFLARIALWTRASRIAAPAGALPATADITWRLRQLEREKESRPPTHGRLGIALAVACGAVCCLSATNVALSEISRVSAQRSAADSGVDSQSESDQSDDQTAGTEEPREVPALSAAAVADLARLQGVWQVIAGDEDTDPDRFSIHIDGTTLWPSLPPPLAGPRHFVLDTESEPKRLVFAEGDRQQFQVYRFAGDRLQWCFNPDGGEQPTDFDDGVIVTFRRLISGEQLTAVRNGLAFLSQAQQPDGSFHSDDFDGRVGVTALCTLALVNGGDMAPDDRHERIGRAVDHILSRQITRRDDRGYFKGSRTGLYDLGFAIWLLSRLHRVERYHDKVHEPLERAVAVSIGGQQDNGGWGYRPDDSGWSDLSNTVVQLRALAEARRAGFAVPEECFASGFEWLRTHQNESGQFTYTVGASASFSCTAQALSALKHLKIDEGPVPERGWQAFARYLDHPRTDMDHPRTREWFIYGSMFAVDALDSDLDQSAFEWYRDVCATLIEEQRPDGSWRMDSEPGGPEIATALACLALLPRSVLGP